MADARRELPAIQPYDGRSPAERLARSLGRDQDLLDRGGRTRMLCQDTQRYSPAVTARYEQPTGDAEARTLDQITERLIVIDRTVAFIPAGAPWPPSSSRTTPTPAPASRSGSA